MYRLVWFIGRDASRILISAKMLIHFLKSLVDDVHDG